MYTPGWPLTGYEHTEYTEEDVGKVIEYLRSNYRMQFEDRMYLATMLEQLQKRILELTTERDKLEAACRKAQNG